MTVLAPGDRLLPDQFGADDFDLRFDGSTVVIEMRMDGEPSVTLEASSVLSFRFRLEQDEDPIEGSFDTLLVLQNPAWDQPYQQEDSFRGEFVREKKFYHLNIPDIGIFECWAVAIARR